MDGERKIIGLVPTTPLTDPPFQFIINAIMTVVVGLFGFFLIPDYPNRRNPLAFWFTKADAALAMERLERHNRAEPKRMDLKAIK